MLTCTNINKLNWKVEDNQIDVIHVFSIRFTLIDRHNDYFYSKLSRLYTLRKRRTGVLFYRHIDVNIANKRSLYVVIAMVWR